MALSFYAGNRLASAKGKNTFPGDSAALQNMRGQRGQNTNGMIVGTLIAKDVNNITVALRSFGRNGGQNANQAGSKIVLYTDKTTVQKTVDGSVADLSVGKEVSITGNTNADGSVSAKSISIRTAPPIMPQN